MSVDFVREALTRLSINRDTKLVSPSGDAQKWLIDLRPAFLDRDVLSAIAKLFWDRFQHDSPFQVAAIETAGIPLLTAILLAAPRACNGVIVRKERKRWGACKQIEGNLSSEPIVFVDDALNSGNSAELACTVLEAEGGKVTSVFAVVDFHSARGIEWCKKRDIYVHSLFAPADFGLQLKRSPPAPSQRYEHKWSNVVPGGLAYHVVPKSAPVLKDGVLYRGCDASFMHAFSAHTGKILWEHHAPGSVPLKGVFSTPALHNDRLYYGAYNGCMYALNAADGSLIWEQQACEWIGSSPLVLPEHNMLIVGYEYARPWRQGSIAALDLGTGEKVWEVFLSKMQHGSAAYWRRGGLIIVGSADHELVALRPNNGEQVWSIPTNRSVKSAPFIDESNNLIAYASNGGTVYVADINGKQLASWNTEGMCRSTPLIANGKVFCGSADRRFYIFDLVTAQVLKSIDVGARVFASPVLVGDRVVFGTCGGVVFEVNTKTLEIEGRLQIADAITNAIAVPGDGRIMYVSTAMNALHAFERL